MSDTSKQYLDWAGLSKYDELIKGYADTVASNEADDAETAAKSYTDSAIEALSTSVTVAEEDSDTNIISIYGITQTDGVIAQGSTADVTLAAVASTGAAEDVSYSNTIGSTAVTNVDDALDALVTATAGGVASKTVYITETAGSSSDPYSKRYGVYQGGTGSALSPVVGEKLVDIDIPKDMVVSEGAVVNVVFVATDNSLHEGSASGADVTSEIKGSETATVADAGMYIKLTIANTTSNHLWIKATDLVDIYTSGSDASTDEIVVVVDNTNNQISAGVGTSGIASSKVNHTIAAHYDKVANTATYDSSETYYTKSGNTYTEDSTVNSENFAEKVAAGLYIYIAATTESVQSAIDRLDEAASSGVDDKIAAAINALDANTIAFASYTQNTDTITINAGVKQENGLISAGSGDTISISPISDSDIESLFANS